MHVQRCKLWDVDAGPFAGNVSQDLREVRFLVQLWRVPQPAAAIPAFAIDWTEDSARYRLLLVDAEPFERCPQATVVVWRLVLQAWQVVFVAAIRRVVLFAIRPLTCIRIY